MTKVTLSGYILVPDEDLDAVQNALPEHIEKTKEENGCILFQVSQDENDPNRFNVYEEFESKESFEAHQKRARKSRWGRVSANVKRYYEIAES